MASVRTADLDAPLRDAVKAQIQKSLNNLKDDEFRCPVGVSTLVDPVVLVGSVQSGYIVERSVAEKLKNDKLGYPYAKNKVTGYFYDKEVTAAIKEYRKSNGLEESPAASSSSSQMISSLLSSSRSDSEDETKNEGQVRLPIAVGLVKNNNKNRKVLCIGDSTAGKSDFMQAISGDFSSNYRSTRTIDFQVTAINNTRYQIWDTASQEQFRGISSAHYRSADMILFFGDDIGQWVMDAQQHCAGIEIYNTNYDRLEDGELTPKFSPYDSARLTPTTVTELEGKDISEALLSKLNLLLPSLRANLEQEESRENSRGCVMM